MYMKCPVTGGHLGIAMNTKNNIFVQDLPTTFKYKLASLSSSVAEKTFPTCLLKYIQDFGRCVPPVHYALGDTI